jgi:Tfp pilus assembly protein PilV
MRVAVLHPVSARRRTSGMTLLEIMVALTMMTVIVLGLYSMFDRTQQALRDGTTQVDVLEIARANGELLSRELEQARATGLEHYPLTSNYWMTNFWIDYSPTAVPITNVLIDGTIRTTAMHQVFFLTRDANWRAIAYIMGVPPSGTPEDSVLFTNGVGALYRYERTYSPLEIELIRTNAFQEYVNCRNNSACASSNFFLVSQGVVSFRVDAYDSGGTLLSTNLPFAFTNAQTTAYIQLELGVLETHVLEQAKGLAFTNNPNLSRSFLTNQTGRLHMFRHRIPIRAQL